ncbi:MAG: flap endonuclease-1 [Candidatus Bathyarchaeia archaeon]
MGVDLGDLISRNKISLEDLSGKAIAIDAYNAIYQFLSIIRGIAGEPLKDREGRITSHLSGLFYRTANLLESGIKPVYVFDGKPPSLKEVEIKRRMKIKEEAITKYEDSLRKGDLEGARRYAQMTSKISDSMIEDAKRLLDVLGVPWVQAPSEGEAQATHMAINGDVWGVASQDYDSLLFGSPRLVRNLTLSGRRKLPRKDVYVEVEVELIELDKVLRELGITREQLVDIGILIGTDFNPDGIEGIGPKKALRVIKENGRLEAAVERLNITGGVDELVKIREIFLNPEVSSDYRIEWKTPSIDDVIGFLCHERDFSESRVKNTLDRIMLGIREAKAKKTLEAFFR